jgi:hypothetical protein
VHSVHWFSHGLKVSMASTGRGNLKSLKLCGVGVADGTPRGLLLLPERAAEAVALPGANRWVHQWRSLRSEFGGWVDGRMSFRTPRAAKAGALDYPETRGGVMGASRVNPYLK